MEVVDSQYAFTYIRTNQLIKLMFKAVLFDMDGVIVDTEPLHHKSICLFSKL